MSVENETKNNTFFGNIRVDNIDPTQDVFITGNSAIVNFARFDGLSIHIAEDQVDNLIDWAFSIQRAFVKKRNEVQNDDTESSIWDL